MWGNYCKYVDVGNMLIFGVHINFHTKKEKLIRCGWIADVGMILITHGMLMWDLY